LHDRAEDPSVASLRADAAGEVEELDLEGILAFAERILPRAAEALLEQARARSGGSAFAATPPLRWATFERIGSGGWWT
jgi:hypothetical protein